MPPQLDTPYDRYMLAGCLRRLVAGFTDHLRVTQQAHQAFQYTIDEVLLPQLPPEPTYTDDYADQQQSRPVALPSPVPMVAATPPTSTPDQVERYEPVERSAPVAVEPPVVPTTTAGALFVE